MASPQLCFGKVHHSRLRPARNAFNYGVYFLRLPLRSMLHTPIALRFISRNRFNLLSFFDKDHGDGKQPLLNWIDDILKKEGIDDAKGEVWLQTFPRVLGYVFNPVSFWFCHQLDGQLRAVLCDVSNTFGERHYYLLDPGGPLSAGVELKAIKLFHVSPFCKVEGSYRFHFVRSPSPSGEVTLARIDYHDDKGRLLLTSISGKSRELNDRNIATALLQFPLMTFMVVARIHWQALKLWLKQVPFYRKPPLPQKELSR
jgi:DUF1365 family protein